MCPPLRPPGPPLLGTVHFPAPAAGPRPNVRDGINVVAVATTLVPLLPWG